MICNICGSDNGFKNTNEGTLRESLTCKNCGSISRDRAYIWTLGFTMNLENIPLCDWPDKKTIKVFETSGYRCHPKHLLEKFDYYNPKYSDDLKTLKEKPREYANLENLQYGNNFFDYTLSSDVFEHVRQDNVAFENIYNTLKPEGYFVLTTPLFLGLPENQIRVRIGETKEQDVPILNKFHHSDKSFFNRIPVLKRLYHSDEALVYRIYGLEIMLQLNHFGFFSIIINVQEPQFNISAQEVVLSRKGKPINLDRLYKNPNVTIIKNIAQENA